jgi:O-antigen ligase
MMLFQIMRTGTRAALVSILFGLILGPVFARGTGILKRSLIPLAVSVFIVGTVLYILSLTVLPEQSQERLSVSYTIEGQIKGEGELSRPVIWKNVLATYIQHRPVTGFGFGNSMYAMDRYRGYQRDIHSSILAPLVDSGPVGLILFIGALIFIFLKVRKIKNPRIGIAAMTVYMFMILSLLAHTIHFTKYFWIPLTLCLLLVEQNAREEMETDYQEYLGE